MFHILSVGAVLRLVLWVWITCVLPFAKRVSVESDCIRKPALFLAAKKFPLHFKMFSAEQIKVCKWHSCNGSSTAPHLRLPHDLQTFGDTCYAATATEAAAATATTTKVGYVLNAFVALESFLLSWQRWGTKRIALPLPSACGI